MILYDEANKKIVLEGNKKDLLHHCIDILILLRNAEPGFRNEKNYNIMKEIILGLEDTFFNKKDYSVSIIESKEEKLDYSE